MTPEQWRQIKEILNSAAERAPDEREKFVREVCGGDGELAAEVVSFLDYESVTNDGLEGNIFSGDDFSEADDLIGERIGVYKIEREIGRGGMGAIYLAVRDDGEFSQQVAVKVIKRGMDTDAILQRFRRERQILARLNHPNIASLLDGGTSADGLPYFVMEYVEGVPIDEYAAGENLPVDERLELFMRVCSAVSFAHRNLIVHSDLKPSNILVTKDGVPKLLDFGISKLLNPDKSDYKTRLTLLGNWRAMTPEYASPEQARGETLTTAADVYSLGIVLYELLTGRTPHKFSRFTPDEIINVIENADAPRPSSAIARKVLARNDNKAENPRDLSTEKLRRRLRGDLDRIVLQAICKNAEDRYSSVENFAEDIRRHLRGLPVNAVNQTVFYRLQKFVERKKLAVGTAFLILFSILTGAGIAVWQAREARAERAKAERRFNEVRQLANTFLFKFDDQIKNLSGATPARKMIVENATVYLDNLAREAEGDLELQSELANAYNKLGEIQGHPAFPNIGDTEGALRSAKKAVAIGENLTRAEPENQKFRFDLAASYNLLGDLYERGVYDTANALENYQKSQNILEKLNRETAENAEYLHKLATVYERVGNIAAKTGEFSKAEKNYLAGKHSDELALQIDSQNAAYRRGILLSHFDLGDFYFSQGRYEESLQNLTHLRQMAKENVAKDSNDADSKRMIGYADDMAAKAYLALGEKEAARESATRSLEIRERLFAADPTNIQVYGDLTVSLDTVGEILVGEGKFTEGLKMLERSLEMREAALKQDPSMTIAKRFAAISRNKIGNAYRIQNNLTEAIKFHRTALEADLELTAKDPINLELRRELAEVLMNAGITLKQIAERENSESKRSEARILLKKSAGIWQEMKRQNKFFGADAPKFAEVLRRLA